MNGDGHLDLLVANYFSGTAGVLLGNGDGTFQPARAYTTGGGAGTDLTSVVAADVNGDGKPDILATNYLSDMVGILLGNGDGTFQPAVTCSAGETYLSSVTVVYVNGDSKPDLLVGGAYGSGNSAVGSVAILPHNFVTKNPTATALASSLNPSIYGQKVTFTVQVTTSAAMPPTGTVVFKWKYYTETYTIGSTILNSAGVATLTKSNLNGYLYPMIAVYKGDTNNLSSTSPVLNQAILQTTSKATLTSTPNPSTVGQVVTFTAKITSPTVMPTGPVTFTLGKTTLGTAQLSGGKATFTTSALPAGSNAIKVTYNGNSNIARSSAAVTQIVQP